MFNKFNKRAQTGETITWIFATVIIVVILLISIFFVSLLIKDKVIEGIINEDILASKSFFSYLLTKDKNDKDGKTVYEQLKNEDNLNAFSGNLAKMIFEDLYQKEYQQAWIGISDYKAAVLAGTWNGRENDYFGKKPATVATSAEGAIAQKNSITELVHLKQDSAIESLFVWGLKK